jgi:hypothetical protein
MSDTQETGVPVFQAPSSLPLNIASFIRLIMAIVTTLLINAGKMNPSDADTWIGAALGLATVLWILFKNTNAAKTLAAWMGAPAVTVIENNLKAFITGPRPPSAAVIAALGLFAFMPLVGCAQLSTLAGKVATNTPVTTGSSTQASLTKAEEVIEQGYDVLQTLYLANEATMTPATKARVKGLLGQVLTCTGTAPNYSCSGYLAVARASVAANDSATLAQEVTEVEYLLCVGSAASAGKPPTTCTAPTTAAPTTYAASK